LTPLFSVADEMTVAHTSTERISGNAAPGRAVDWSGSVG
jgi:hypothetical protein